MRPLAGTATPPTRAYSGYVLLCLLLGYTFNFLDRVVVGVLQEPLRNEFSLSDFQLGLLGGPAFAILYTVTGIPIARWADRGNRVFIVSLAIGVWSAMTAVTGLAASYLHLLLARIGVSIGEAGCSPPSQSLISDYFPPERRGTAFSIFALGVPMGNLLAAVGASWIAFNYGWRVTFGVLGVAGILLSLLIRLTVREPQRTTPPKAAGRLIPAARYLFGKPAYRFVVAGTVFAALGGFSLGQYLTSYFVRVHELNLAAAGLSVGMVTGVGAGIGTFSGGVLADRLMKRFPTAQSWLPGIGVALGVPLYLTGLFADGPRTAMIFLMAAVVCHFCYLGPMFDINQSIAPPRMRSTAVAILLLFVSLLGLALGPPILGALSDFFAGMAIPADSALRWLCLDAEAGVSCTLGSAASLRAAMMIMVAGDVAAAVCFLLVGRTLLQDREEHVPV